MLNMVNTNKKGLAPVVATLLIVLLTIVSVTILAAFIIPFVRDNLAESTSCLDYRDHFKFQEKIDFAGGKINWWLGHPYLLKKFNSSETEFIIGCSMLIPLKIIKSVGGFDRNYFAYFEDTDFCERVKNFGKKIYITKNSKIYHKISQTSKFKSDFYIFYYARNRIIFNKKYNKNLFKYLTFLFFQYIIKTIGAYFYLDKGKFKAWIEGIRSVNKEKHF